jgi:hypothetical protein
VIYEVITPRWVCPTCALPLRLLYVSVYDAEGKVEAIRCDEVQCRTRHEIPRELVDVIGREADGELERTFQGGFRVGEIWQAPDDQALRSYNC